MTTLVAWRSLDKLLPTGILEVRRHQWVIQDGKDDSEYGKGILSNLKTPTFGNEGDEEDTERRVVKVAGNAADICIHGEGDESKGDELVSSSNGRVRADN